MRAALVGALAAELAPAAVAPARAQTPAITGYFVAMDGSDTWSGRLPVPNSAHSDGPFATLPAALAAVRASPYTRQVYVREGAYRLGAPVAIGQADSGLQILAFPGEHPAFSGGLPVPEWRQGSAGSFEATVPLSFAGSGLPTLLVAGAAFPLARWPLAGPGDDHEEAWLFADSSPDASDLHSTFRVRARDVHMFDHITPSSVIAVFGQRGWQNYVLPIARADRESRVITLAGHTWDAVGEGSRYAVINAITTPGTWSINGGQLDAASTTTPRDIVAATLPCIVLIDHAQDVTLSGLALSGTATEGAGLCLSGGQHVTLDHLSISDTGDGIRLDGTDGVQVSDSTIERTAGFGIVLRHGSKGTIVRGNWLHDIGWLHQDASAIWFDASSGNLFAYNRIERVAKFGIGGGSLNDGGAYDNRIEANDIDQTNRRTSDGGGILVIGWAQDVTRDVIRGNLVTGTGALGNMGWDGRPSTRFQDPVTKLVSEAIYLDDWASGVEVADNLLCGNIGGIALHAGWDNRVTGNVMLGNAGIAIGVDAQMWLGAGPHPHAMERNSIERNVVALDKPSTGQSGVVAVRGGSAVAQFDHNLYFGPGLDGPSFHHERDEAGSDYSFRIDAWRRRGQDQASSVGDPAAQVVLRNGQVQVTGIAAASLAFHGIGRPEDQASLEDRIRQRCHLK